jgi:hypothetical protein
MSKAATKPKAAPEGMMWDGKHLIEAGLGTWVPFYKLDGEVEMIWMPYPCPEIILTIEQEEAIAQAKRGRRKRGRG